MTLSISSEAGPQPDPAIEWAIRDAGLIDGSSVRWTPLTGGVSSDIWRLDTPGRSLCVKRALAKLKVADDWRAPVSRNKFEVRWMQTAGAIEQGAAPEVLLHDPALGLFVMPYLPPAEYPLWKAQLMQGRVVPADAAAVGARLGRIHGTTADDRSLAAYFPTDEIFHAIRLEPYLLATAQRHPDVAPRLRDLAAITARTKQALVHGDVSPKNILIGPHGPVFLDAECAWWGDPAFDLAFCLNHLLLKCLPVPTARPTLRAAFAALVEAYDKAVQPALGGDVRRRAGALLPGLFLARVDGKSPVEYITEDADRHLVRDVAKELLTSPPGDPIEVAEAWHRRLDGARPLPSDIGKGG